MTNDKHSMIFRKAVLAGVLAAAGVALSVVSIPMGPTKCFPFQHTINVVAGIVLCFPFQHTINVIAGIVLGPWWAVGAAFTTSVIRNLLGTGSLFAFPGSMFGALFVGLAARALPDKYKIAAACAEPVGTGIVSFLVSSVPGAVIGAALVWALNKRLNVTRTFGTLM